MRKIAVFGVGAAGNKAAIEAIKLGVVPLKQVYLVNTTEKDIPEDYKERSIIFGDDLNGCGKERKLAKSALSNKMRQEGEAFLSDLIDPLTKTIVLVTSTEGGTGSGSVSTIAKYYKQRLGLDVHVVAFTGFESDVRGLKNTVEFFKDLDPKFTIQAISNKKFLEKTGGNILQAQKEANIEFCKRLMVMSGAILVPSAEQNIDDTDLHKVVDNPNFMTIEYREFDKIKRIADFDAVCREMIDNSKSLDFEPTATRMGVILSVSEKTKANLDLNFNVFKEKIGHAFEVFTHIQSNENDREFIVVIGSGMKMPVEDIQNTYDKYIEETKNVDKEKDSFFKMADSMSFLDDDDMFDMQPRKESDVSFDDFLNSLD